VFAGSDCVLKCAINDSLTLGWYKNSTTDSTTVYSGYEFANPFYLTGRFEIVREKTGTHDLQIRRSQPSDAGEYKCGRNEPTLVSAQLVVIGKSSIHPEIKVGLVRLSIFILFRGHAGSVHTEAHGGPG